MKRHFLVCHANRHALDAGTHTCTPYPHSWRGHAEGVAGADSNQPRALEDLGRKPSSDFGTLLRRYRLAAGLSQETLAERARLSTYGISALERGFRRTPQRQTLELLAEALALDEEQRRTFRAAATVPSSPRRRDETSIAAGPWPDANRQSLPLALTSFIGRKAELEEIATLVREHRFVTVTGAGGVGKTQTALRVASILSGDVERGGTFVNLAPIRDASLVAVATATALGVQEVPNRPLLETLVAFLRKQSTLLVLDNCEHVIAEAATVVDVLLRGCPNLRILATSRASLRAGGERTYRLPSLDDDDAIMLFADRAQAVDARFVLTDENRLVVHDICRRLDCIPLAVELAAARVNVLPLAAVLEGLCDCFRILSDGYRTALPRQRTMRATIDWSYNLLPAAERRLFERLSVFAGGCTLQTAQSVCAGDDVPEDELLGLLSSLAERSLVVADLRNAVPRYRLLEPFRQYARDKLTERGEHESVAARHALALLHVAEHLDSTWDTAIDPEWDALVRAEIDDWRAALEWSLARRADIQIGQRLVSAPLLLTDGFAPSEWQRWIELAGAFEGPDTPLDVRAALSYAQCKLASNLKQQELELQFAGTALGQYQALGDELRIVKCEIRAANALVFLGRLSESALLARDAIVRARRLGLRKHLAQALEMLAFCCRQRGDFGTARRSLEEARDVYASVAGPVIATSKVAHERALCFIAEGNAEAACHILSEEAVGAATPLNVPAVAQHLSLMGFCFLAAGDYDQAESCTRESLTIERRYPVGVAMCIQRLTAIALGRQSCAAAAPIDLCERGARLLGFVNATLKANGSPRGREETDEYERALTIARGRASATNLARLMDEGAAIPEDQAIAEALAL
jgi:predicted ATPase/ribosome-binding protein aMBF1 (putative translation factor)